MSRKTPKKLKKGPCYAMTRNRVSGDLVSCPRVRVPLRKVTGLIASVEIFLCARHVQRADIRARKIA